MNQTHDWQTSSHVLTMLDGTESWSATVVCECGYQCATDTEYPTSGEACAAADRIARWSSTHGDL